MSEIYNKYRVLVRLEIGDEVEVEARNETEAKNLAHDQVRKWGEKRDVIENTILEMIPGEPEEAEGLSATL